MLKFYTTKSKKTERVTVVIPLFNAHLFDLTLEGLCRQTCDDFKIVIVNDGGYDFDDLIRKYSQRLNLEYYYLFSPRDLYSVVGARNLGIHCTKTNRVIFLDNDCVPSKTFIEENLKYSDNDKRIVAGVRFRIRQSDQHKITNINDLSQLCHEKDDRYLTHPQWRKERLKHILEMEKGEKAFPLYCHGFCVNYLTDDLKSIGGFSKSLEGFSEEDQDLAIRLCKTEGYATILDKNICSYHLDHSTSDIARSETELKNTIKKSNPVRNKGKLIWYNYERRI